MGRGLKYSGSCRGQDAEWTGVEPGEEVGGPTRVAGTLDVMADAV